MDDETWRLAHELAETPDRDTFLRLSSQRVGGLVGGDCFWMEADFASQRCSVWAPDAVLPDPVLSRHLAEAADHPAILSYVERPDDLTPRRLSDVATRGTWRRTAAFEAIAGAIGQHQLSMVTRLEPPTVGHGWIVGRPVGDFSDRACETAHRLLPVLHALERSYAREAVVALPRQRGRDDVCGPLTTTEKEIVALLAQGLTADAIGRRRGISGRTVRKHLEHAYAKLGTHDRLLAVQRARQLGLILSA